MKKKYWCPWQQLNDGYLWFIKACFAKKSIKNDLSKTIGRKCQKLTGIIQVHKPVFWQVCLSYMHQLWSISINKNMFPSWTLLPWGQLIKPRSLPIKSNHHIIWSKKFSSTSRDHNYLKCDKYMSQYHRNVYDQRCMISLLKFYLSYNILLKALKSVLTGISAFSNSN